MYKSKRVQLSYQSFSQFSAVLEEHENRSRFRQAISSVDPKGINCLAVTRAVVHNLAGGEIMQDFRMAGQQSSEKIPIPKKNPKLFETLLSVIMFRSDSGIDRAVRVFIWEASLKVLGQKVVQRKKETDSISALTNVPIADYDSSSESS